MASHDFFIIRMGDINDPAAPLAFYPPKGTDELHDALKRAYPHLPNLQARMREAVIEFYLKEQSADYDFASQTTPDMNILGSNFVPSPTSSFSANADPTVYTPPIEEASSSSAQTPASTAPAQQDLMNVWTLPTSTQTKIHKRRNMTTEEKVKYKAKRLTGACDDCRRRRRKCQHDQSLTQNVSPITPSKVSRQKRASTSRPIASRAVSAKPAPAPAAPPPLQFDDALLFTGNSFDVSTPFSTEMSSADPSMLSFESTLGTNSAWDMPFDLGNDFELSPFLTNIPQTDWDMTNSWLGDFDPIQVNPATASTYVNPTADGGRSQYSVLQHDHRQSFSELGVLADAFNRPSPTISESVSTGEVSPRIQRGELADARNRPSPIVSKSISTGDMPPGTHLEISPTKKSVGDKRPANIHIDREPIPTITPDLHRAEPQSAGPPRFSTSSLAKAQQLRRRRSGTSAIVLPEDEHLQLRTPGFWPSDRCSQSDSDQSQHPRIAIPTSKATSLVLARLLRTGLIWSLCALLLWYVGRRLEELGLLAVPLAMVFFERKSGSGFYGRIRRLERRKGVGSTAGTAMVKLGKLADCRERRVEDWYV